MLQALPPAQIQVVPSSLEADREVTIPAFGGVNLKASLRSASGHPCFAIMVADSGPTDRNWSSPLLRDPRQGTILSSHGGHDIAGWLQGQGIGSVRYDKRLVGSRDPRMDISLEAQVGDLRAVITFVRQLPEARGRRLLLIGHGEGALLSLLAASDADALLMLSMPGQTMARTISQQLRSQLPQDISKVNLDYLESVFLAIRQDRPAPTASGGIHPSVLSLAQSLMAPESLSFVKATLDLDPWAMASKLAIPSAMAWGDKDIQTPKPEKIPTTYQGRIIDLPECNHLLKRETRPTPLGPEVLLTYGDSTPMANLKALAEWLQSFTR